MPTRDGNILDHCYTVLKDAYHSVPRAALGLSDHCLVHLLPAYRQKLKSSKPILRTVKRWTVEAEQDLQACFELTDWSVFEAAATDLDELTDTVTSYISFCEDMCVPTRTYLTFNTTNLGSVQNSNSFAWPKRTPTGVGKKPCTNRPNTHWIGR